MATRDHIRNPVEWVWDLLKETSVAAETTFRSVRGSDETRSAAPPQVRRIELADLRDVLARGLSDFGAYRTDVIFLSLIYPLIGLILMYVAFDYRLLPLIFPLASGAISSATVSRTPYGTARTTASAPCTASALVSATGTPRLSAS